MSIESSPLSEPTIEGWSPPPELCPPRLNRRGCSRQSAVTPNESARAWPRIRSDAGSAPAAVLAWTAGASLILGVLLILGVAHVMHGRAQATADLAALSAADAHGMGSDACAVATNVAEKNGGFVRACAADGETVTVDVGYHVTLPGFGERAVGAVSKAGPDPRDQIGW